MAKGKGRPTKFDKIDMNVIETCVKKGFTDKEISDMLRITVRTFHNWKKQNKDFFHSLKDWKNYADEKVERSLYERATGYEHIDTHFSNFQGIVTATEYTKCYAPDPTSMIFWLKNRKPKDWRDRIEINSDLSDVEI